MGWGGEEEKETRGNLVKKTPALLQGQAGRIVKIVCEVGYRVNV
jgi:hypothetical protein